MSAAEICHELCLAVYSQNVMNEGTVRQCCRMFKNGRTDVHNEEQSGQLSIVSEDLVQSVDQEICERRCFTISELLCEFSQISCALLCEIIRVRPDYHKFCTRWIPKMLKSAYETQRLALALTFYSDTTKMALNFLITLYE
jgi:hypothetical protein